MYRLAGALVTAVLLAGCSAADHLDCSDLGSAYGQYADANNGALSIAEGVAWRNADDGYTVVMSDHRGFAEAMQRSLDPAGDMKHAADLLGLLLVGAVYRADGEFASYFTAGSSTSSGSGGGYAGSIEIDEVGCARGNFSLDRGDSAVFALPLWRAETAALYGQAPEGGEAVPRASELERGAHGVDPLADWKRVHAQLMQPDPAEALLALGLSLPVAEQLARDPAALAALQRLRTQCPDPARARLNDYGEVEGPSSAAPDITLGGWVQVEDGGAAPRLRLCSVSQRNGESVEQCFPLTEDCREAVIWRPTD